jgi:alkylation response protein AidB-like acyl-CoA dehydrogenase
MEAVWWALDFSLGLPDDVLALQGVARDFAQTRLRERGQEADRTGELPWGVLSEAGDLGLCAPGVPEAYGGPGVSVLAQVVMMEELGWGNLGLAMAIGSQGLVAAAVARHGGEEQKRQFLARLAGEGGLLLASLAVTEPEAGAELEMAARGEQQRVRSEARRIDGGYLLEGRKRFIINAGRDGVLLVLAQTDADAGLRGASLFLVRQDIPGVQFLGRTETSGLRSLQIGTLDFQGCELAEGARLGQEGQGFPIAREVLQLGRVLTAAAEVGTARAAYEAAMAYARERRTMGRPIIEHQQVAGMLARMRTGIDAARLLVLRAAGDLDAGRDALLSTAEANFQSGEAAVTALRNAVQTFGGYGYTQDFPVEMWLRDVLGSRIAYGGGDVQLLEVAEAIARGA